MHVINIRMYRGNLRYQVVHAVSAEEKRSLVHKLVDEIEGPGDRLCYDGQDSAGVYASFDPMVAALYHRPQRHEWRNRKRCRTFLASGKGVIQAVKGDQITAAFPTAKRNSSCQATC